jgi:hypothetical protein
MSTPTNPPVFPTLSSTNVVESEEERHMLNHYSTEGITLRDWFAGQALPAFLGLRPDHECTPEEARLLVARSCYAYADAMLRAREETP